MILTRKQLLHLPVETQSGRPLGRVIDIDIETDGHTIWRYHVARGEPILPGLTYDKLMISPSQVISLDDAKMIVEDALVKDSLPAEGAVS